MGGGLQLVVGNNIAKKKLWGRMPGRIRRQNSAPGYRPFYSGDLVKLYTVVNKQRQRRVCFDLHKEAVKALQHLKVIGSKRGPPSQEYTRIEQVEDDEVHVVQNAAAETKRIRRSIIERRGQSIFRRELLQVYGGKCAVTGCTEMTVLEAAHIVGFSRKGRYEVRNGLLLRADWHTLFDLGMWAINPTRLTIELLPSVASNEYARFRGRRINLPDDPKAGP